jgi:hypothetical protein
MITGFLSEVGADVMGRINVVSKYDNTIRRRLAHDVYFHIERLTHTHTHTHREREIELEL